MIKKDVVKYWVHSKELLTKMGLKESDLLMDIKVYINPHAPLGHKLQGVDLFVEHSTEI